MVQHWNFQPDGQVKNDVGNCLTALVALFPGPGLLLAGATVIRAKGGIALLDRRGVRRNTFGVAELLERPVTARAASATMVITSDTSCDGRERSAGR